MKELDFYDLQELVVEWAKEKGIPEKSTPLRQLDKTQEEVDETREALQHWTLAQQGEPLTGITDDLEELKRKAELEIGDIFVTLILLCNLCSVEPDECLGLAYDKIKSRTGKMVNGFFVKDA